MMNEGASKVVNGDCLPSNGGFYIFIVLFPGHLAMISWYSGSFAHQLCDAWRALPSGQGAQENNPE